VSETDLFDLDLGHLAEMGEPELHAKLTSVIGEPTMLRAQAVAKQKEVVELARRADHVEQVAQLRDALAKVETALTEAQQHAKKLTAQVDELTEAEAEPRAALAGAEQHHGEVSRQHETYVSLGAKASRLSESLVIVDAARRVMEDARRKADAAASARTSAQATLTEAREQVQLFTTARDAAKALTEQTEANPDAAPRSLITLVLDWQSIINPSGLPEAERVTVRGLVALISNAIGADGAARQAGREETQKQAESTIRRATAGLPARDSVTIVPPPQ
jgi:chromosome segregation ATPase